MESSKFLLVFLLLAGAAVYLSTSESSVQISNSEETYKQYIQWKSTHSKNYNGVEDEYRFNVWLENLKFVNSSDDNTIGMNVLADLTNEEYRAKYINQYKARHTSAHFSNFKTNPDFVAAGGVNWVTQGAVTPVQDQGQCGSCWAFGTVGGLEGVYQVTTGNLVKLSEQQLVDCDKGLNMGCNGGLELYAYQYTQKNGIMTEASYPYTSGRTGKRGTCQYNASDVVFKNTGYFQLTENDPNEMVQALSQQPLSKGIAASSIYFQLYSGGVMQNKGCGTNLDHSVTLVAYEDGSTPYWTIKNSWGTGWGSKGFMNILKQMEKVDGVCGVNMDTTGAEYKP